MESILSKASTEQLEYIEDLCLDDSKLIATAGSGKTFSIIARVCNMLENNIFQPKEVFVLTFSRQARNDFVKKVKNMRAHLIERDNIRTIDSFAKHIIDPTNIIDMSILSYTLKEYLRDTDYETLKATRGLEDIKILFVDEAQDLNHTQYEIILLLKKRLNIKVQFVGDPNQNIFQFRGGCDKYLVEYPCEKVYKLTKNYRSFKHLIEFSSQLQKYNQDVSWHNVSGRENAQTIIYGYQNNSDYEFLLSSLMNKLKQKIPLHKIAILAPTKGYLSKNGYHRGLCYIANLLHDLDIPVQMLYDDMSEKQMEGGRSCELREGHVTLMTYTASKGLEWDYVILVDANAYLISKRNYTKERFQDEQYLLYVATTRAKKGMYIFTKNNEANPWFDKAHEDSYKVINPDSFFIKPSDAIVYPEHIPNDNDTIPFVVFSLEEDDLFKINSLLKTYVTDTHVFTDSVMKKVESNKMRFVQTLLRLIFQFAYAEYNGLEKPTIQRVESLMNSSNVIFCEKTYITYWFENNKEFGWDKYNSGKVPETVKKFVSENIPQSKDMDAYTLVSDKFYNSYILVNRNNIMRHYNHYLDMRVDDTQFLDTLLYLSCLEYAIITMHYFYIKDYKDIFGMFIQEENKTHIYNCVESCKQLPFYKESCIRVNMLDKKLVGTVDYHDGESSIFLHFSTSNELRLQEKLNFLLQDYAFNKGQTNKAKATVYNLAFGLCTTIEGVISNDVISILQQNPSNSRT